MIFRMCWVRVIGIADYNDVMTGEVVSNIAHFVDKPGQDLTTPVSAKLLFEDLLSAWVYASLATTGVTPLIDLLSAIYVMRFNALLWSNTFVFKIVLKNG